MVRVGPKRCTTLDELADRLRSTDLIPSQRPLLEGADEAFAKLADAGIGSVADIRWELRNKKAVAGVAARTGIDESYLMLLRRAVRGFFPEPTPLGAFGWIAPETIAGLATVGIRNSEQLWNACVGGQFELAERPGASAAAIAELANLAGLVRVQWISPNFARALLAAGYQTAAAIAAADPTHLTRAVADANKDRQFYNATIGERDMGRVIEAAGYVE